MNLPKIILPLFILSIFALIAFSYSLPNEFIVTKSININSDIQKTNDFISQLQNWEKFNPISSKDKDTKYSYFYNKDSNAFAVDWVSEVEGKGRVEIVEINSKGVKYLYNMIELNQKANGLFIVEKQIDKTKLTWVFKGKLENNPVSKLLGYFSNNVFGFDMDKSLIKIKQQIENNK